jgi:hypothetical protein
VRNTTAYHDSFRWVVRLLAGTGSVGWSAAVLNSLLIVVDLYVIYRLLAIMHRESAVVAMALAVFIMCLDRTQSVGASYLFSDGLQPSSLATTGWLFGIWAFLRARYLVSGVLLAGAGIFHANFLILGIGLFTLTHLFLGKEKLLSRWARQIGPSVLVLLYFLPLILSAAGGDGAAQAREIFLTIRAPHHYYPLSYLAQFWYLGGWAACGFAALFLMRDLPAHRSLLALVGALALSVGGATLLTTVVFIPQISQLYVWRLAPFLQVFCELLVTILLVRQLAERRPAAGYRTFLIAIAGLGALAILRWVVHVTGISAQVIMCAALIAAYLAMWQRNRASENQPPHLPQGLGIVTTCVILAITVPKISYAIDQSTLFHPDENALHRWAHSTSKDATFLIPPELENFRLLSERAVVVDWKSTPISPSELINWYDRINAIAGRTVHSADEAVAGYRSQSLSELKIQARRYGANYVIVDRARRPITNETDKPVFSDREFAVYAVPPARPAVANAADR